MQDLTQEQKIITTMLRRSSDQQWFYPPDFMSPGLGDLFVGYEASARLSGLASRYPKLFETRQRGKYKERRLRLEAMHEWYERLPFDLSTLFRQRGIIPSRVDPVLHANAPLF